MRRGRAATAAIALALLAACASQGSAPGSGTRGNPVLIVGGTVSPELALGALACRLRRDGFTVFTLALGGRGLGDIAASARAVAARVEEIRAATGAAKVDLVGHSQGGLENRFYLKRLGGAERVGTYVSLGTPQQGTALASVGRLFAHCFGVVACEQMASGSPFLAELDAGGAMPGPVRYVAIYTALDGLVVPFWRAGLGSGATNAVVQAYCPLRLVGHIGLLFDGAVYGLVRSALRGEPLSADCLAF